MEHAELLDAAALVDSAGEFFVKNSWNEGGVIKARSKHAAETRVEALAEGDESFMGTPSYMAPECFVAAHASRGPNVDVWSLGVSYR